MGPVYTTENECHDCYKCVRQCPVKAIRIVGGKASVIPEACIACGGCVKVCPAHAKKIRSDLSRLRTLLDSGAKVYASIAPSFTRYFKGISIGRLAAALKEVGFAGVSETAHGAECVSAHISKLLAEKPNVPVIVSSACPAVVDMIRKYRPSWIPAISPIPTPVRAHCRMLRDAYGEDIKVVFVGPCAAKKNESDSRPNELALAVIFPAIEQLFEERGVLPEFIGRDGELALGPAAEGRFYSIEGGMNDTIRDGGEHVRFISVSGLENIRRLIAEDPPAEKTCRTLFIEALACPGGCVNGPAMKDDSATPMETILATDATAPIRQSAPHCLSHCGPSAYPAAPAPRLEADETMIAAALARVGKFSKADELNCGACGYNSCRDFAWAMLEGKAEEAMCHNFLRQNFQRTSNALIRYIPAAVVIVDGACAITECNRNFAVLVGAAEIYEAAGTLNTIKVDEFLPDFADLFTAALEHGSEIEKFNQHLGDRIVNISVFPIAKGKFAGAVIQDVTTSELHREQVAERAREVIRKNVLTVQQVARLFGEHIAETEILLNEIAGSYQSHTVGEKNVFLKSGGFN